MSPFLSRRLRRRYLVASLLLATVALGSPVLAQSTPSPDPAGIATGDKTNVTDAGGNAFVVVRADGQVRARLRGKEEGVRRVSSRR